MKISDYILLLSATIVVIGWFVNSYLNRRHEITKKRIDHRIDILKNYISFYIEAQKSKSLDGFNHIQVSFYLYGYDDEIELIEKITNIITTEPKNPEWLKLMTELNILIRNRLRTEIGLPKVKIMKAHIGIGTAIADRPSHTTRHTDRVPRRFGWSGKQFRA